MIKHGLTKSRFYRIWRRMNDRMRNPKHPHYRSYGGSGMKMVARWTDFMEFKKDMYQSYLDHSERFGEKNTSLDRVIGKVGYWPQNCRWVTPYEQQQNRKDNVLLEFEGEKITQSQLAKQLGINFNTIRSRVRMGWDIKKIVTTK